MIILAAASAAAAIPSRPLNLHVDQSGGMLVITLIGDSRAPMSANYSLEVTGGANGNSNRSVQSGTARLGQGHPVVVATLRLGELKGATWAARLWVTPSLGSPYDLQWRSAP